MESKRCTGWWEQSYMGRQPMEGLMMEINGNHISGSGYDVVGSFTFSGTLGDGGEVLMTKQYLGAHSVHYRGEFDGSNLMWGVWSLTFSKGPWEIRFRESEKETEKEVNSEKAKI